jgi:hypothetical protein
MVEVEVSKWVEVEVIDDHYMVEVEVGKWVEVEGIDDLFGRSRGRQVG